MRLSGPMAIKSENFENGAFIVSRSIFQSEIWFKPPEYLKIWLYLFGKANHKRKRIKGYVCERGQYFCDYKELLMQVEYKIGFRKKKLNESFMKTLMKHLRSTLMIATVKKPRGVLVTICNYSEYQQIKNYEKTNKKTYEKTKLKPDVNQESLSINKNEKNVRIKEKNICAQDIFDLWNTCAKNGVKKANKLTQSRKVKINTRLKEEPEIEYWQKLFTKLSQIPFYCGKGNRGWKVSLDYVMENDNNHVTISEEIITNNFDHTRYEELQ